MIVSYNKGDPLLSNYVYYERLKDHSSTEGKELYSAAKSSLNNFVSESANIEVGKNLFQMAKAEEDKELRVLQNLFGIQIVMDLDTKTSGRQIIEAFNAVINLKSAYKRNVARISRRTKNSKTTRETQIDVSSFFATSYFTSAFNRNFSSLEQNINAALNSNSVISINQIIVNFVKDCVSEAIDDMLRSKDFKDDPDSTANRAYLQILQNIRYFTSGKSWLKNKLYELYNLDELAKLLEDEINQQIASNKSTISITRPSKLITHSNTGTGVTREYFENFITNYVLSTNYPNLKIRTKAKSTHTGYSQMKADNIITFNIDPRVIQNLAKRVENNLGSSREKIVDEIEKMYERLKKIDDRVIIYSNAKNYALTSNFKGFSAGEDMSLKVFQTLLKKITNANVGNLIGGLMQTAEGAIGEGYSGRMVGRVAEYIAYFLFDDFTSIGNAGRSDITALHLFNLNGIYIPLSFFLKLIAEAMMDVGKQPEGYLKVKVKSPKILWPDNDLASRKIYSQEDWDRQRDDSLNNTRISIRFLRNFVDIVEKYLH